MILASFLVEPDPPASSVGIVVLDVHLKDSFDPSEGVDHRADECAIPEAHDMRRVDRFKQCFGGFLIQNRVLPFLTTCLGHERPRPVERDDLSDDEPIEEHADRSEPSFHGWLGDLEHAVFHESRDMKRLDRFQRKPLGFAPVEEVDDISQVGLTSVLVPDLIGEVGEEPLWV